MPVPSSSPVPSPDGTPYSSRSARHPSTWDIPRTGTLWQPSMRSPRRVVWDRNRTLHRGGAMKWFSPGDIARVAVFAALIAVLGLPGTINAFGGAVPITLQTFGVMLAGLLLGSRRAALAVAVLLLLALAGLPLLAGGRGGLGVLASPTVGSLLGWLPGAFVTGWIAERGGRSPSYVRLLVASL